MHFNTNDEVNYISTNLKNRNYEKKSFYYCNVTCCYHRLRTKETAGMTKLTNGMQVLLSDTVQKYQSHLSVSEAYMTS